MESKRAPITRRGLLAGAAGVGAGGLLAGATPDIVAAAPGHRRVSLWEVAWRRGIVYGGSISTWM
jgi:hypothetical protein